MLLAFAQLGPPCPLAYDKHRHKLDALWRWALDHSSLSWERLYSCSFVHEHGRHLLAQQQYDHALMYFQEAIALKMFPYTDPNMLDYWQQSLVVPGFLFRRQVSGKCL